jgi:hypothetical protein
MLYSISSVETNKQIKILNKVHQIGSKAKKFRTVELNSYSLVKVIVDNFREAVLLGGVFLWHVALAIHDTF